MAVTIEELQILLKCDAKQAQAALNSLNESVDKTVKKMSNSGQGGNKTWYETMSKKLETATKKMSDAYDRFNETGDGGAKADLGYYSTQVKKYASELSKFRDEASKAFGGRSRDGAIGDAIENMSYLDKSVQKVSDHVKRMPNLNSYLSGEAPSEPTVEVRGRNAKTTPYKDQWSAVSHADLMSGYSGDMMRRAAAWMNNAQNELGSRFQSVDTGKLTGGSAYERLREQLKVVENRAESLRGEIASIGDNANPKALMTLQTQLETAERKAEKLAQKMAAIEDGAGGGASTGATADGMRDTGNAAQDAVPKIENYNNAVKATSKSSSFFSKASKFAHGMFDKFGKSFKHHEGFLSKFGKTLKRVMMRMLAMGLIRGVINGIRQGLQLLAQSSSAAAEQYGRFTAMSKGVKAALGGAALAVLNALSGVLYSIASAAIAAANAVAAFFAVIGGSSTYIGVTLADSFDNLGDSIGGAGGAAKGLLADFDELNIIGQQGGGGGGGGLNGTSGVGTEEMSAASILADLLKAEQFEQAGAYIAQKLDEVVLKIDDWFVRLDEKHYGEKFARVLNGIFSDKKLFEDSGKAIGDGLNVVIHAFDEFTNTFDGKQAGEALAAGVNTMVDTVDWESAGRAVSQGLNKITDAIRGFFENFDGDALGASLASTINNAILGIDASSIGAAATVVAINAIDFLISFLANMDWVGIFSGIIEFIVSAPLQILEGLLSRPSRILRIIKNFIKLTIKTTIGLLGSAFVGLFNFVTDALITGCNAIVPGLGDTLFGDAKSISEKITKGFDEGLDKLLEPLDWAADELDKKMGYMEESVDNAATTFESSSSALDTYRQNAEGLATSIDKVSGSINGIPSYKETTIKINTVATGSGTNGGGGGGGGTNVNVVLMKMARGGIAYGDTLAHIGEYPNVKSNPEVVAPLSDLQGILAKTGSNSADVKRQNELLSEQNKLLRVIAAKEIKLSPTPELGQVVTKAQALYGAV